MRRASGVGVVLLLAIVALASPTQAQTTESPTRERSFRLGQNYPNPFNPTTRIPLYLDASLFEGGRPVRVTVIIANPLRQLVAYPTALNHPAGNGAEVNNLEYFAPGEYEVFWDGTDRNGNKVASGLYFAQLVVNGQPAARPERLVVAK